MASSKLSLERELIVVIRATVPLMATSLLDVPSLVRRGPTHKGGGPVRRARIAPRRQPAHS
jgi:hypothetical protein